MAERADAVSLGNLLRTVVFTVFKERALRSAFRPLLAAPPTWVGTNAGPLATRPINLRNRLNIVGPFCVSSTVCSNDGRRSSRAKLVFASRKFERCHKRNARYRACIAKDDRSAGRAVARLGVSALREQGVLEIVDRPAKLGKLVGGQRDRC